MLGIVIKVLNLPMFDNITCIHHINSVTCFRNYPQIMRYKDEKMLSQPAVQDKNGVHISMTLISDDTKLAMLYRLHKAGESWKIYDVEIEGVSILLTYRSQFNDTLSHGTVDDLISQLEKPAGS